MPTVDPIDESAFGAYNRTWEMLVSKYNTAGSWATWAQTLLQGTLQDIESAMQEGDSSSALQTILNAIDNIPSYNQGSIPAYVAPTAPTYTAIPSYSAPTLGTLTAIPAVEALSIPDAPDTAISHTETAFTDSLLTELKARIEADLDGATAAEAAIFARHSGRVASENTKQYNLLTTQFSSAGFDMPPGALLAKQTELSNDATKRLTDASADIMSEAAKQAYGAANQLLDLLGRLNDSKLMREFEAKKVQVQLALEGFKAIVDAEVAKGNLNKAAIEATVAANDGVIKVFTGQIEGQVAPMKAIAESNQAAANAYKAAVDGASASVQAAIAPEELKIKGIDLEVRSAATKGEVASKAAMLELEDAKNNLTLQVSTLQGLAQSAAQMIASSLNSVSTSASFGYSASASSSTHADADIDAKIASNEKINQNAAY